MAMTTPHFQADTRVTKDARGNYVIKPRGLNIVWGNDERYWKLPKQTDEPAELLQVSWLEVTGSVNDLRSGKAYNLTFDVEMTADAFGWKEIQVFLMAKVGKKGKYKWKRVKLEQANTARVLIPDDKDMLRIEVPADTTDNTLHFGLYEVWSVKWKGGLKIYDAKVTEAS